MVNRGRCAAAAHHRCNKLTDTRDSVIQVSIDAQGLLKITHMINLQHIMEQDNYLGLSAYSESQASMAAVWDR